MALMLTPATAKALDKAARAYNTPALLRAFRERMQWTQNDLAEALGCTVLTIKRNESDDGRVPRDRALACALIERFAYRAAGRPAA